MIKKIFFSLMIMVGIIFFLSACIEIKKPSVEFKSYELVHIDYEKVNLEFIVIVNNPNPISLDNASYSYQLDVNKSKIAMAKNIQFNLNANGSSTVRIPVELKYTDIFSTSSELLSNLLKGMKSVPYRISGQFQINFIAFPYTIPFENEGSIPLPKMPKINGFSF